MSDCNCFRGSVWATCDGCGTDCWCVHHCDFPCDDVTCENTVRCRRCLEGIACPVHHESDIDYGEDTA